MKQHDLTDYRVVPSVYPADRPSTVTVLPLGDQGEFCDGCTYTVEVWPAETTTYELNKCAIATYRVEARDNRLTFTHTFEGEQYHVIKIITPEQCGMRVNGVGKQIAKKPQNMHPVLRVYSLYPDLMALTPYKGDMHIHSTGSDGHEDPACVVGNLRRAGYDYAALTDHWDMGPSLRTARLFSALPDVFTVLPGEEVHVPVEFIHELSIGARESVNAYYFQNTEAAEAEIDRLAQTLPGIPQGVDRRNYAARYWVAQKSKEFGGMPIITHPYWIWTDVYFVPPKLHKFMYEQGNYEAFELLNGVCGRETNSMQTAFWAQERLEGYDMPIVGNSDCHATERKYDYLPTDAYTLVFAPDRTWDSIHAAILDKKSVAVEHYEEDAHFRVYGDYRLVKYANFLLEHYFPLYIPLCDLQGRLMKEYAMEQKEETVTLMAALKGRTDRFTAEFFGR